MLSFIHLSDIHFANYSGDEHDIDKDIRVEIIRDIESCAKSKLENVAGILVCGDIAFSGKKEQYEVAIEFLENISDALGIDSEKVYCVPGNHDIDQSIVKESHAILGLQAALSESQSQEDFDKLFSAYCRGEFDGNLLMQPLNAYNKHFAGIYNCDISDKKPYWEEEIELSGDYNLRLRGMNSTVISNHMDHVASLKSERKMLMPSTQIPSRHLNKNEIFLTLCHHPPECWKDIDSKLQQRLNARIHIQLYGHKHEQTIKQGSDYISINSGAIHPERNQSKWIPQYNWLNINIIKESNCKSLRVRVFPRILDPTTMDHFIPDSRICKSNNYVEYKINLSEIQTQEFSEEELITVEPYISKSNLISGLDGVTYKTFVYKFMTLPIAKRTALLVKFSLITEDDSGKEHYDIIETAIDKAVERHCIKEFWGNTQKGEL